MKKTNENNSSARSIMLFMFTGIFAFSSMSTAKEHLNGDIPQKRVLYINSYHHGFSWSDSLEEEIYKTLDGHAEVFVEYMDAKRDDYAYYENTMKEMIKVKYQHTPVDLVLTSDDAAFEFVTKHRDTLFKNLPVVTCGINYMSPEILTRCPGATGVKEGGEPIRTARLALSLFPKTKNIIFITDWHATKRTLPEIKKIERALGGQYAYHHIIEEKTTTLEDIVERLKKVKDPSIVILFGLIQASHRQFTEKYVMQGLNEAGFPVFTFYHRFIEHGAFGGMIQDSRKQAVIAAEMAIELLNGEPVEYVSPVYAYIDKPMFNYPLMQQFGISSKSLPEGAHILGEPDSRITKYRNYLLAGLVFIVVQMVLIISLLRINRLRCHAAKELNTAKQQAEAASQAKSEFLTIISHEMRTPMNAVAGFAELLVDEEDHDTRMEYIDYIKKSSNALLKVINDMLTFTSAKQSPERVRTNACNIVDNLSGLVDRYNEQAKEEGLQLEFTTKCPQQLQPLLNWGHLKIAVSKLIENAIKYSDHGTVHIILEEHVIEHERTLLISVIDQGVGISDENLEKLFDIFQQADTSLKREHQGAGLGLAICRRLITVMGGTLRCESKLKEGSTFQILLPLAENEEACAA